MKRFYTALAALGLALGANAQTVYSLDLNYNGKGYRFSDTVIAGNEHGYNVAIKLNDDGTEYVAVKQNIVGYAEAVAALVKNKSNGTRDSSFATNGIATNGATQDVRINNIAMLNGGKIYCSGSGWGGYVWNGTAWSSQTYGGGVVQPYLYAMSGCKVSDTKVVQVGSTNEIVFFEDNGNAQANNYGSSGTSGLVDYTVNGVTFSPQFNKVAAIPNSHYFTAGVNDSIAFIAKYGASGFIKDSTWGTNGIIGIEVETMVSDAFIDLVALADGKLMAMFKGKVKGDQNLTTYTYRFNADGTLDNTWGANGVLIQNSASRVAILPDGHIALLYTYYYSNNDYYSLGFIEYTAGGTELEAYDFPLLGNHGHVHSLVAEAISVNASGVIAICGSVEDSATYIRKPFIMRLKPTACNAAATATTVTTTTFTATATGVAAPAIGYIYKDGDEGYRAMDTLDANNSVSFDNLDANDTYYLLIRDANGCEVEVLIDLSNPTVGINDIANKAIVSIYPNPATNVLHVTASAELSSVEIINILGEVVKTQTANASYINIADLANGLYIARIHTANGQTATAKFTKQ